MSDPRTVTSLGTSRNPDDYDTYAYDNSTITYDIDTEGGSSAVSFAVTLKDAGARVIETVGDGEGILGKLLKVEPDGSCLVQVGGPMTLPGGSSATLTEGMAIVGDLGPASAEGYIRAVATGTAAELGVCRGFIEDATDTAAVAVRL